MVTASKDDAVPTGSREVKEAATAVTVTVTVEAPMDGQATEPIGLSVIVIVVGSADKIDEDAEGKKTDVIPSEPEGSISIVVGELEAALEKTMVVGSLLGSALEKTMVVGSLLGAASRIELEATAIPLGSLLSTVVATGASEAKMLCRTRCL